MAAACLLYFSISSALVASSECATCAAGTLVLVLTRTHPPANPTTEAVRTSQSAARNLSEIPQNSHALKCRERGQQCQRGLGIGDRRDRNCPLGMASASQSESRDWKAGWIG